MLYQEILWESLLSMDRSHQRQKKDLYINQFKILLIEDLSKEIHSNPWQILFKCIQKYLPQVDCFILEKTTKDYACVVESTQKKEIGFSWPLIGPLKRSIEGNSSIVFNAQLVPVIKIFPLVVSNRITSMISKYFQLNHKNLLLLWTHKDKGFFTHHDQELLQSTIQTIQQQQYRFKLYSLLHDKETTADAISKSLSSLDTLDSYPFAISLNQHIFREISEETQNPDHQPSTHPFYLDTSKRLSNRYELVKKLGEGGQACVYQGYDSLINRRVALKILKPSHHLSSSENINQFIREASLAANIAHPNVVRIFDLGFCPVQKYPFIVMEYLEGINLSEFVKENGVILPSRLLPMIIPAFEAIGEAHQSGLVHRDLKPHNLFLVHPNHPKESIKVLDFGIAQFPEQIQESQEDFVGTLSYLAPEYLKERIVSPQSDIYQMGLILIELLDGKKVFTNQSFFDFNMIIQMMEEGVTIPMSLQNTPIAPILKKATALQPEERFENSHELINALQKISWNFKVLKDPLVVDKMHTNVSQDDDIKTDVIDMNTLITQFKSE